MTGWWWEMAFDASLCEEEILLSPSLWFSVSLKIFRSMEGFVSSSLFCWEGNIFRQSLFPWAVGSQKSTEALRLVRSPGVPSARDRLAVYQASWEYPLFYGQLSCTCKAICFRYFVTGRFLGWLLKLNINHAFLAQFPALYCVFWMAFLFSCWLWPIFTILSNCSPFQTEPTFFTLIPLKLWTF